MKTIPLLYLAVVVCAAPVFSQNEKTPATREASPSPARTYFPDALIVPQFVPPAPAERKALPDIRIDASTTVMGKFSHTVTLQRGEASTLPDLPPTEDPAPAPPPRKFTPEELAQKTKQRQHFINLGATVYDHKVSKIHWIDQESGKPIKPPAASTSAC